MNKKSLLLLLPAFLALASCTNTGGVASTSGEEPSGEHVCDFETAWSTNTTHHWHACKDESCDQKSGYGEHDYEGVEWVTVKYATETEKGQKKRACLVCGYEQFEDIDMIPHTHTYAEEWTSDATYHWHESTCGHDVQSGKEQHTWVADTKKTDVPATYTTPGVHYVICSTCQREGEQAIQPQAITYEFYGSWKANGEGYETITTLQDGSTKFDYSGTGYDLAQYAGSVECSNMKTECTKYGTKYLKSITYSLTNNSDRDIRILITMKDTDIITNQPQSGDWTGDVSLNRHSSGSGEYVDIKANGTGTITVPVIQGRYPTGSTRVMFDVANKDDKTNTYQGSITFGKIKLAYEGDKALPQVDEENERVVSIMDLGFTSTTYYNVTEGENKYSVSYTQPAGGYENLQPNNFADLSLNTPKYSIVKLKNTCTKEIDVMFNFYGTAYAVTGGDIVGSSELNSSFVKNHSSAIEFKLGVGDTATYQIMLNGDIRAYTKLRIQTDCNPETEQTGSFDILDWYIVDAKTAPAATETVNVPTAFASDGNYVFSSITDGQNVTADINASNGYAAVYYDLPTPVTGVQKVLLKVVNPDASQRAEVRVKLKNSSGTVINTLNKDDLTITGAHSNTKIRDLSSEYVVFNVAADDTGTITIPTTGTELGKIQIVFVHQQWAINYDFYFQAVVTK